jgi:hypothetical protein
MLRLAFGLAGVTLGVGCADPETVPPPEDAGSDVAPVPCKLGYLGDRAREPEIKLTALGVDGTSTDLAEGGNVPIITPPQGGRVLFVGARVTNILPCSATITGSLRDPDTRQLRADKRTVNFAPTGDGWGGSVDADIATFANIPVCPNQWASRNIFDSSFELTIAIADKEARQAEKSIHVTPVCAEPGALLSECTCICKQGYVLGERCP